MTAQQGEITLLKEGVPAGNVDSQLRSYLKHQLSIN